MPFQSEKQRRYLWANEPEIARDWTNKYGSRVKKYEGGIMDAFVGNLYNRDKISNLEAQYGAGATGLPSDARHMAAMNELSKTLSPGIVPEWAGDAGAFTAGLINEIPAAFKGLDAKNRAAIMEDIKANWAGTFGTSQKISPEQIYASIYNKGIPTHKKSSKYGAAQAATPNVNFNEWMRNDINLAKRKSTAQKFANLDNFTRSPHTGFKKSGADLDKWGNRRMALENPAQDPYEKPSGLMQFKDWATDKLGTGVNWGKAALSGIGNAIMPGLGWALGAINPGKLRGYNYGQDRYNTQAEYEANRSARQQQKRVNYMLDRRADKKGFSPKNLNALTMGSRPGFFGNRPGYDVGMKGGYISGAPANLGQSVHGKGFGRDHAGTGGIGSPASKGKQQRGGHHLNRGGLASLWPR